MGTALDTRDEEDTQRVIRPARLRAMDLDPPAGPVPAEVIVYFESALDRQAQRERRRRR